MTESDNNASVLFFFCLSFFLPDEKQHLCSDGKKNSLYTRRTQDGNLKQDIIM